jgi:hypothetical protein
MLRVLGHRVAVRVAVRGLQLPAGAGRSRVKLGTAARRDKNGAACPPPAPLTGATRYTLKRNSMTSPSCTTYSLPSLRTAPFSRAPFHPPIATNSS